MPHTHQAELDESTHRTSGTRAVADPTADEHPARVVGELRLEVEHVNDFEFRVCFDKPAMSDLRMDEPPPLGHDRGPNAARVLGAAIGNCLAASLLFCLRKRDVHPIALGATVDVQLVRNERRRLRVGSVRVTLRPNVAEADVDAAIAECIEEFADFCLVTESVREGIHIDVDVEPITEGVEGPSS